MQQDHHEQKTVIPDKEGHELSESHTPVALSLWSHSDRSDLKADVADMTSQNPARQTQTTKNIHKHTYSWYGLYTSQPVLADNPVNN